MVRINDTYTDEFCSEMGLKQGDNLSPNLFSVYINDLLRTLKETGYGVNLSDITQLCCLAYADDIVLTLSLLRDPLLGPM